MPATGDPGFPPAIRHAVEEITEPEIVLRAIAEDHSVARRPRFTALYALLLRLRREERYGEYGAFVAHFEGEFGSEPYYHTFRAILARAKGDVGSLRSSGATVQ